MNMNELNVKLLYDKIDVVNNLKAQLKTSRDAFEKEHQTLIEYIRNKEEIINEFKLTITEDAKEEFSNTKNKKLYGGIGIQERTTIEYDKDLALDWAKEHQLCLTLDNSSFKKIAKSQDIDFVTKDTKILVTFPPEIKK